VPFALDAVVLAVSLADITNVNLSADAIGKIWSGEITNWADPELAKLNPNFELPDVAISFGVDAMLAKPSHFLSGWQDLPAERSAIEGGSANLEDFVEGSLVLTKYSRASDLFATTAGIVTEEGGDGVIPTMETVLTAATMFKTKTENGKVALTFDPKAKAIAPEGIAIAPIPYQAVTLITLALVGEDSLKTRPLPLPVEARQPGLARFLFSDCAARNAASNLAGYGFGWPATANACTAVAARLWLRVEA
jgi:hypothetical protein